MTTHVWVRAAALGAALLAEILAAPGATAQSYPYPQGYPPAYPQGYYPPDPYSQYYAQYYGGYPPPYGQGYYPYSYPSGGYGAPGAYYGPPPAYTGYGSAYGPYYGAPYQPPGYYGQPPAYPPPSYYGGYPLPYPGQQYYDPSLAAPPLGLPYAPPPTSANGFTLTATLIGPNAALLSWNAVPGAVSYAIYQSINGAPMQFASTSTGTSANVSLGMGTYAFQVHALASGGADLVVSNVATPVPGPLPGAGAPQNLPTGPGVPSPANSSVTANIQQGSLFFGTQITVTVLDSGRAPVPGHFVTLVSSRQGIDSIQPLNGTTPVTDQSGRVFFTVRPGQPGQATFTAYVDGNQLGQTVVNFQ